MRANAATVILVPAATTWGVCGRSRLEAELLYMQAILHDDARPAPYRVVAQYKVDQHDELTETSSYAVH